ncbi:MAG: type 1 periplasmic binding fold superfamily protein, partial [Flavobacteriales bacterium]
DEEGNPIGLSTVLTTGEMGSGTITVTLRHEPNKDAAGVSSGDIANAGGETDIEVTFNVEIQ